MIPEVLNKLSYGLYIVSSSHQGKNNGLIASAAFQVTADPNKLAVSLNRNSLTCEMVKGSGMFAISVLEQETPFKFFGTWGFRSGRDIDKFKDVTWKTVENVPVIQTHALAYLVCKVVGTVEVDTHTMFIGQVVIGDIIKADGQPITYDYYHRFLKGKTPKSAPTYTGK